MRFRRRPRASDTERKYATERFELGLHYAQLPAGDLGVNLRLSIKCFTEALRFFTADATPLSYAMAQFNLGNAYQAQYALVRLYPLAI